MSQRRRAPVLNLAIVEAVVFDSPSTRPAVALKKTQPASEQAVIACQARSVQKCTLDPFKQVVIQCKRGIVRTSKTDPTATKLTIPQDQRTQGPTDGLQI